MTQMLRGSFTEPTTFTVAAGLSTDPVSTEPYWSEEFFQLERERIFRRAWLNVARSEAIPAAGDYIVKEIEVCNASIVISRQENGSIRAFHNVCSHRSNKVVINDAGNSNRLMCRYHSWVYKNDGSLIGVPDAANFFNLDKARCGLTPVACDEWEGWIFVNLDARPEVSLAEFLGEFGRDYAGLPYASQTKTVKMVAYLNANWKVIADAFAETYHVPSIHPKTIGATFSSAINPFSRPIGARFLGPHRTVSTFGNRQYQTPANAHVERLAYSNSDTLIGVSTGKRDDAVSFSSHPAVNATGSEEWAVDISWLFPNFSINITPGGYFTHHFWPITRNQTRWEAEYRMPEADSILTRLQQEHFVARTADILVEDVGNTERTQLGLESGAKSFLHLQDSEVAIRHSLHHVRKWVEARTVREALTS